MKIIINLLLNKQNSVYSVNKFYWYNTYFINNSILCPKHEHLFQIMKTTVFLEILNIYHTGWGGGLTGAWLTLEIDLISFYDEIL